MANQLGDSKFILNLGGFKGVILYPALGSPAILKEGDPLNVVLAADQRAFQLLKMSGGDQPDSALKIGLALKFYAQLLLRPWDSYDGVSDYQSYLNRLINTAAPRNNLYGHQDAAVRRFEAGDFFGFYLGEINRDLNVDGDKPVNLNGPQGSGKQPFGVLHSSAVDMYLKAGYRWLFQLSFKTENLTPALQNGLMELVFLFLDWKVRLDGLFFKSIKQVLETNTESINIENRFESEYRPRPTDVEKYLVNPGDELLLEIFDREVNKGGHLATNQTGILRPLAKNQLTSSKGASKEIIFYRLFNPEPSEFEINPPPLSRQARPGLASEAAQNNESENQILDQDPRAAALAKPKRLSYLSTQNGVFLASRHPVYFTHKNYLDIGVMADTHINARQTLFKLVTPQMIEGAPESDSEFLGAISRETLWPSWRLMKELGASSDLLLWLGDLYDFVRSIKPAAVAFPSGSKVTTAVKRTADLWRYFKFSEQVNSYHLYPRFTDAVMALSLVHGHYKTTQKPLCLVAGNHEGMDSPYGTSPRIMAPLINSTLIRTNTSVASDNNLTFYEAALLFGKEFKDTYLLSGQKSLEEIISFFKKENLHWFYQTVSPWKDLCISIGGRQNLLLFGWGESQDIIVTTVGGGTTLPRANKACTAEQLELARAATKKNGAINILASHFSYVCYEPNFPLLINKPQKLSGNLPVKPAPSLIFGPMGLVSDLTDKDYGTFYGHRNEIYGLFETKKEVKRDKIHFTICGHTHRCGAYLHESLLEAVAAGTPLSRLLYLASENRLGLRSVYLKNNSRTVSLVSGSSGNYSSQNLIRGINGRDGAEYDLEPSQGLQLVFDDQSQAQKVIFTRDSRAGDDRTVKPRLAVRLDYLWYESSGGGCSPFLTRGLLKTRYLAIGTPSQLCDIGSDNLDSWFVFKINPDWAKFFHPRGYSGRPEIPLSSFTLYAVHKMGSLKTAKLGPMVVREFGTDLFCLKAKGRDLKNFLSKLGFLDENIFNWLFFFSVALKDVNGLKDQYNIESPWCWPVTVDFINCQYFYRPFGDKGELPDFDKLKYIYEYS
ncbi:MAG: hypothetical protein LBE80_05395 [Deltaproteobacteria bacterium]|jgi:hypothetical protein|nr:hypothetical protein [Deltaproteobacteria bacterium]